MQWLVRIVKNRRIDRANKRLRRKFIKNMLNAGLNAEISQAMFKLCANELDKGTDDEEVLYKAEQMLLSRGININNE